MPELTLKIEIRGRECILMVLLNLDVLRVQTIRVEEFLVWTESAILGDECIMQVIRCVDNVVPRKGEAP